MLLWSLLPPSPLRGGDAPGEDEGEGTEEGSCEEQGGLQHLALFLPCLSPRPSVNAAGTQPGVPGWSPVGQSFHPRRSGVGGLSECHQKPNTNVPV